MLSGVELAENLMCVVWGRRQLVYEIGASRSPALTQIVVRCISLLSSLQSGGHCLKDNTRPCDQLTSPAFRHLCSSTGKLDQAEKFSIGFPVLIDKFLEMFLKWDEFKMRERNGCLEGVGCSINATLMLPIYQKRNTGVSGSCCLYLVTRAWHTASWHRDEV